MLDLAKEAKAQKRKIEYRLNTSHHRGRLGALFYRALQPDLARIAAHLQQLPETPNEYLDMMQEVSGAKEPPIGESTAKARKSQGVKHTTLEALEWTITSFFDNGQEQAALRTFALFWGAFTSETKIYRTEPVPEYMTKEESEKKAMSDWESKRAYLAATLVLVLACPAGKADLYNAFAFLTDSLETKQSLDEIEHNIQTKNLVDLTKRFNVAKSAAINGKVGKVTVLGVNIKDVHMTRWAHGKTGDGMHGGELFSSFQHPFVIAVGREGWRLYQGYGGSENGMSLDEWIMLGGTRVRGWDEAKKWLRLFERFVKKSGTWTEEINGWYNDLFLIDLEVCAHLKETERAVNLVGKVEDFQPYVQVHELGDVQLGDLTKFEFIDEDPPAWEDLDWSDPQDPQDPQDQDGQCDSDVHVSCKCNFKVEIPIPAELKAQVDKEEGRLSPGLQGIMDGCRERYTSKYIVPGQTASRAQNERADNAEAEGGDDQHSEASTVILTGGEEDVAQKPKQKSTKKKKNKGGKKAAAKKAAQLRRRQEKAAKDGANEKPAKEDGQSPEDEKPHGSTAKRDDSIHAKDSGAMGNKCSPSMPKSEAPEQSQLSPAITKESVSSTQSKVSGQMKASDQPAVEQPKASEQPEASAQSAATEQSSPSKYSKPSRLSRSIKRKLGGSPHPEEGDAIVEEQPEVIEQPKFTKQTAEQRKETAVSGFPTAASDFLFSFRSQVAGETKFPEQPEVSQQPESPEQPKYSISEQKATQKEDSEETTTSKQPQTIEQLKSIETKSDKQPQSIPQLKAPERPKTPEQPKHTEKSESPEHPIFSKKALAQKEATVYSKKTDANTIKPEDIQEEPKAVQQSEVTPQLKTPENPKASSRSEVSRQSKATQGSLSPKETTDQPEASEKPAVANRPTVKQHSKTVLSTIKQSEVTQQLKTPEQSNVVEQPKQTLTQPKQSEKATATKQPAVKQQPKTVAQKTTQPEVTQQLKTPEQPKQAVTHQKASEKPATNKQITEQLKVNEPKTAQKPPAVVAEQSKTPGQSQATNRPAITGLTMVQPNTTEPSTTNEPSKVIGKPRDAEQPKIPKQPKAMELRQQLTAYTMQRRNSKGKAKLESIHEMSIWHPNIENEAGPDMPSTLRELVMSSWPDTPGNLPSQRPIGYERSLRSAANVAAANAAHRATGTDPNQEDRRSALLHSFALSNPWEDVLNKYRGSLYLRPEELALRSELANLHSTVALEDWRTSANNPWPHITGRAATPAGADPKTQSAAWNENLDAFRAGLRPKWTFRRSDSIPNVPVDATKIGFAHTDLARPKPWEAAAQSFRVQTARPQYPSHQSRYLDPNAVPFDYLNPSRSAVSAMHAGVRRTGASDVYARTSDGIAVPDNRYLAWGSEISEFSMAVNGRRARRTADRGPSAHELQRFRARLKPNLGAGGFRFDSR
ncbi:uncharacterized protein DSM5745_09070 [Aspergillus mulundensis]|uniref:Uncharacterized protein n=1 Tax=Aspergillus mulundensis TaxID=1810919 RepID=A0A3D8R053_9EURO|nr:hypothetical protein DSM5745_09070 [Aspergillus mulundensis]RDW67204.1 hypothetical protein DSM5745_09070 [Aspergillus mulundensis]